MWTKAKDLRKCSYDNAECEWQFDYAVPGNAVFKNLRRNGWHVSQDVFPVSLFIEADSGKRVKTSATLCSEHYRLVGGDPGTPEIDMNYYESAVVHEEWLHERTFL